MTIQRNGYSIHFTPETPVIGRFADIDLHFTSGPLEGLTLGGFSIVPVIGGGRLVQLSPKLQGVDVSAEMRLRESILSAYREYEELSAADPSVSK